MFVVYHAAASILSRFLPLKNDAGKMVLNHSNADVYEIDSKSNAVNNLLPKTVQNIFFDDGKPDSSSNINSENVLISLTPCFHGKYTNKIIFREIVHHAWEKKYYYGNQLAVTLDNKYLAYVVQDKGVSLGVRVTELESSERNLIKIHPGDHVIDVAFSYHPAVVMLSFITSSAKVFIYHVKWNNGKIECEPVVAITHDNVLKFSIEYLKVIWCPYDSECDNSDCCYLLTVLVGKHAFVYDVQKLSNWIEIDSSELTDGRHVIKNFDDEISGAVFSPDATTLALTCFDGLIKFYQLKIDSKESPKCIHEWIPHNNHGVTNLYFLDAPVVDTEEPTCWAYALTISDNDELKLWACTNWKCLQTIKFNTKAGKLRLKINVDISSEFLFVSDINNNRLFVMHVEKTETKCFIHLVHQYLLKDPILSFSVSKIVFQNEDLIYDNDDQVETTVLLKFYCIEPQDCRFGELLLQICSPPLDEIKFETYDDSIIDGFNDTSLRSEVCMNLMTPDDFNIGSQTNIKSSDNQVTEDKNCGKDKLIDFTSGSSSPSREVEEILTAKHLNESKKSHEQLDEKEKSWSDIPMMKSNIVIESEKNRLDHEMKNSTSSETANGVVGSEVDVETVPVIMTNGVSVDFNNTVVLDGDKFEYLIKTITHQNSEIQKLQIELKNLTTRLDSNDELYLKKLELCNEKNMDRMINSLHKHEKKNNEEMKKMVKDLMKVDHISKPTTIVDEKMLETIYKMIETCVNKAINPENIQKNLQVEITNKIHILEKSLRDQIPKMITNKPFIGSLITAINVPIKQNIDHLFRDDLNKHWIPTIEKICNNMFIQIRESFEKGVKEYISVIDSKLAGIDNGKSNESQLNNLDKVFNENLAKYLNEMSLNVHKGVKSVTNELEKNLTVLLKDTMSDQFGSILRNHTSINESINHVPASRPLTPSQSTLATIRKAIKNGEYNTAFHSALASSDITLVNYVCERVLPVQLFNEKSCPLKPNVLLALIQQLSADLNNQTENKLKFLEEALANFNLSTMKNDINKRSLDHALNQIMQMVSQYKTANPDSILLSQVNRISIMIKYFLSNI